MAKLKPNLSVNIGGIKMKNPIMVASGTFGCGREYEDIVDLSKLGAIVTKTITMFPKTGNMPPRIAETASGMLNSIGVENDGVEAFIKEKMPYLKKIGIPVIVSIAGEKVNEFVRIARRLREVSGISGIEINISCPNLKSYGASGVKKRKARLFSQNSRATYNVVKKVKRATGLPLITKLTPNVTDITEIARAAQDGGSDALSLVNTYMGMAINIQTKKPRLGNVVGGLSGPAIKPMALKAVWDVFNEVDIPIIGMGGISTMEDVLEFMICGASAVALGSINFVYPDRCVEIEIDLKRYVKSEKIKYLREITGSLKA